MYRVTNGQYAVELLTSGRDEVDEFDEMREFITSGDSIEIIEDLDEHPDVELIVRDYA